MKKIFLLSFVSITAFLANGQNVGIGTTTPTEKLDVSGNVNVTGALKVNGNAGNPGDVLMSTGAGLSWGSKMGYKKCTQFTTAGSATFTVPAGVTEVMVELWGGGSGGTTQSGGTSGGYARTVQTITPGYDISLTVGAGSNFGSTTTLDGGPSLATFPLGFIEAYGGTGVAIPGHATYPKSGTAYAALLNPFFEYGNTGTTTQFYYSQKNATTYVEKQIYGEGGSPVGMLNTSAATGDIRVFENSVPVSALSRDGQNGTIPSSGGGAGNLGGGWPGASGMILIWYN